MARRPRGHALHERDRLHARLLRVRGALEASAHLVVPRRKVRHPRGGLLRARRDADAELRGRAGALTATPRKKLLVRAVRKPGSVPALPPVAIIPLGRPLLDGSCDQLGIGSARATPAGPPFRTASRSRTGLAPGGVCRAPLVTEGAVRSYRAVSPLPAASQPPAVCSLLHFPSSHLDWPLASTLPCGARTFLDGREARRDHLSGSSEKPANYTAPNDCVGARELCSCDPVAGGFGNPPRVPILTSRPRRRRPGRPS